MTSGYSDPIKFDPKFETEFETDLLLTEVDEVRMDSEVSSDKFFLDRPIEMKAWSNRIHKNIKKIPPT
jgi:hypothetical protein